MKAHAQGKFHENKEMVKQRDTFWSDHEPTGNNGVKVVMGGI